MEHTVENIKVTQVKVAHSDGVKTQYSVVLTDANGVIKQALKTTDPAAAKDFLDKKKSDYPGAKMDPPDAKIKPPGSTFPAPKKAKSAPDTPKKPPEAKNSPKKAKDLKPTPTSPAKDVKGKTKTREKSAISKKAQDRSGMLSEQRKLVESLTDEELIKRKKSGAFQAQKIQPKINYDQAPNEKIAGRNPDGNALIVCGSDRPSIMASGYGAMGHTQCDAIRLTAGMGGPKPKQATDDKGRYFTSPNNYIDASIVYLSQKANVNKDFGLGHPETQEKYDAKSCAVMKSDHTRIIGRESLQLVTNTDVNNSQGGEIRQLSGIELIANNDNNSLQPIPLGDNTKEALEMIVKYIEKLANMFHAYTKYQMKFNAQTATHTHRSPFYAKPTLPALVLVHQNAKTEMEVFGKTHLGLLKNLTNLAGYRNNFLRPSGGKYINSKYNKVN